MRAINITTEGYKHLGAALASRSYFEEYVGEKVEDWVSQVIKLAEFAVSQPQASYEAFTIQPTALVDVPFKNTSRH